MYAHIYIHILNTCIFMPFLSIELNRNLVFFFVNSNIFFLLDIGISEYNLVFLKRWRNFGSDNGKSKMLMKNVLIAKIQ